MCHPSSLFKLSPTLLVPKPSARATQTPLLSFPFPTLTQPSPLLTGPRGEGRTSQGVIFPGYQDALQAEMRSGKREVDASTVAGRGSEEEGFPEGR